MEKPDARKLAPVSEGAPHSNCHRSPERDRRAELCSLAHDLNNCLAIVIGECELLADLMPPSTEATTRLKAISLTARRMAHELRVRTCPSPTLRQNGGAEFSSPIPRPGAKLRSTAGPAVTAWTRRGNAPRRPHS
jgi:hypothetical protein